MVSTALFTFKKKFLKKTSVRGNKVCRKEKSTKEKAAIHH